ncbi:GatB/YqeY domain-containing protein [Dolosigranulum pigrum]|uniref:GatB/YqeY domain-containing protein n=1 Tax=Dolosigranulum pigrum TaxID=29394 RepID=UPI000DBF71C6|nr:GatB/YqeY domain-containing protein [Dolosigranulum pigrum]QTJ34592.1 GatB/YqeY domain-containing protein [Dolosigranulum pigrum]QTJ39771.1 GatB/YqeY domain-containing protein [Dolosigranulum pigrum]QTJ41511.1 GatB/YqeY domain-containing protein [Dolosigranulum pigrum]QTJ48259.1 GatB/YqeY domain-containing protein [Dolosigranulum pigrum]QTJ49996.1 GatB/YqeY domain-containing protein [Dolosigranulum pigrum]
MSVLDQLNQDMKVAMKAKDKAKLKTIRMLKASLQNEKLAKQDDLTEQEELDILAREKKQRLDSLQEFKQAGRDDLVDEVEEELAIVAEYLPEPLSDNEVKEIIQSVIDSVNASGMQDMGKVMGAVMPKVKGRADGNFVSEVVKAKLSE